MESRLTAIGPIPPPVNGQAIVTDHMIFALSGRFSDLRFVNTGPGNAKGWRRFAFRIVSTIKSISSACNADVVYIAVKASRGMWITSITAGLARLRGARVFLHHHSYSYVLERKFRMVALARMAGPAAYHIVLAPSMRENLGRVMPEITRVFVLSNAGLIDRQFLDLPLRDESSKLVLGHLSNLSLEKGLDQVIDLALGLSREGVQFQLIVAGPAKDHSAQRQIDRASRELGKRFEYRGALEGKNKLIFFEEISHFVFPTRYVHEAVPLVLYEALASGVVCVATSVGSISEQLERSPAVLVDPEESFVEQTLPVLARAMVCRRTSRECREAYVQALTQSEAELSLLLRLMEGVS